jgi:hypothetical protein
MHGLYSKNTIRTYYTFSIIVVHDNPSRDVKSLTHNIR